MADVHPPQAGTSAASTSPTPATSSSTPPAPASPSSTSDPALPPFSSALYAALSPALSSCDSAIASVFASQDGLAAQIDALAAVLSSFHALQQQSLFSPYTAKLQSAKRRIRKLQTAVDRIHERMDDLRELIRRREGIDGRPPQPPIGASATEQLTGSLRGLTEKVASSLASIAQPQRTSTGRPRSQDTQQSEAEQSSSDVANGSASSDSVASSAVSSASVDSAPAATVASNNALLHDLLAWDE